MPPPFHGSRPRSHDPRTSIGDRNVAGSLSAVQSRAKVCWCTGCSDVVAGETGSVTLHIAAKPELPPDFMRAPRLTLQVLREVGSKGMPPIVECEQTSTLIRTAPTTTLRYGPLRQAGPFLLAITIDGAHVAGSPFLLQCRPAPPVGDLSSFDATIVEVRAGEVAQLKITSRDRYGNRCATGGARVSVHDQRPEHDSDRLGRPPSPSTSSNAYYHEMALSDGEAVEVVDLRNGAYEARVLLNKAGVRRFVGCVDGVPFNSGPIELCVLPNALHAPSCIPYGDALECFVIAGHTNILKLDGRDKHNNKVPTAGRAWHATLEVLAPDASKWQDAEPHPTVRDDPDAPTGHYRIEILPPHAGPIRLTLRPLSHGIPATEAFTIGFIASPSPADPLAFHVSGEALRVAVAGEPAQLVVRPRSFGTRATSRPAPLLACVLGLRCRAVRSMAVHVCCRYASLAATRPKLWSMSRTMARVLSTSATSHRRALRRRTFLSPSPQQAIRIILVVERIRRRRLWVVPRGSGASPNGMVPMAAGAYYARRQISMTSRSGLFILPRSMRHERPLSTLSCSTCQSVEGPSRAACCRRRRTRPNRL